jgi:hypothetical protein
LVVVADVSGQTVDSIFKSQAAHDIIYIQILNGRNVLEDQGVGGLMKLRQVFRKYDKGWDQLVGFGEFVMEFKWYRSWENFLITTAAISF